MAFYLSEVAWQRQTLTPPIVEVLPDMVQFERLRFAPSELDVGKLTNAFMAGFVLEFLLCSLSANRKRIL